MEGLVGNASEQLVRRSPYRSKALELSGVANVADDTRILKLVVFVAVILQNHVSFHTKIIHPIQVVLRSVRTLCTLPLLSVSLSVSISQVVSNINTRSVSLPIIVVLAIQNFLSNKHALFACWRGTGQVVSVLYVTLVTSDTILTMGITTTS